MPADPKTNTEPYENLTASEGPCPSGAGRQAPPRRSSRRPEDNYPPIERETGTNRKGADAPGGPVNIGVKGGAAAPDPAPGPEARGGATGRGSRDAPGGLPEE